MISIIIPTINEEKALPATLENVFMQTGDYEIIVVDGGSTDNTIGILSQYPTIKVITATKGRASQMNAGAQHAKGEWLLFLHADTLLPKEALTTIENLSADSAIETGGFKHRFSGTTWGLRLVSWLHNFRCKYTHIFYGDQAMFIRKKLFDEIGGFPNVKKIEDLLLGEKLVKVTQPYTIDKVVITDSRKFEKKGVWLSLLRVIVIQTCHELHLPFTSRKFFNDVR